MGEGWRHPWSGQAVIGHGSGCDTMAIRGALRVGPWATEALVLGGSIRYMSTSLRQFRAAPAPNSPYTIFDREAKRMQRSRAALRRPVDDSGMAYLDESHRGEVSRLTDYVRDMGAISLAERLQVRKEYLTPGYEAHVPCDR